MNRSVPCLRRSYHTTIAAILLILLTSTVAPAQYPTLVTQEVTDVKADPSQLRPEDGYATAPANHGILLSDFDAWIFVPLALKEQYQQTINKLEELQRTVGRGEITATAAENELTALRTRFDSLRAEIEKSQVKVAKANLTEQTQTMEFELGSEKCLAITSNQVHIVGWDQPQVKAVLKKSVLTLDIATADEHLKAMQIQHQNARADFAGKTEAEWLQAMESNTKNEQQSPEDIAQRTRFLEHIRQSYMVHRSYAGKSIDQLTVSGMDYQSNPILVTKVKSEGGEGEWGSARQRYAELTVYVPNCQTVVVRGAKRGLTVKNLSANLIVVDEDSTDSNPRAPFSIDGLKGNLDCRHFPLKVVRDIQGDVSIESYLEFGVEGGGTKHWSDFRELTPPKPLSLTISNVTGSLKLNLGKVDLSLSNIAGKINCENLYGNTSLKVSQPLVAEPQRVVQQSGTISVELSRSAWESISIIAASNFGSVKTNLKGEQFADFMMQGVSPAFAQRRNWNGFRKVEATEDPLQFMQLLERFPAILDDQPRSAGLDLFSSSGNVSVIVVD